MVARVQRFLRGLQGLALLGGQLLRFRRGPGRLLRRLRLGGFGGRTGRGGSLGASPDGISRYIGSDMLPPVTC